MFGFGAIEDSIILYVMVNVASSSSSLPLPSLLQPGTTKEIRHSNSNNKRLVFIPIRLFFNIFMIFQLLIKLKLLPELIIQGLQFSKPS